MSTATRTPSTGAIGAHPADHDARATLMERVPAVEVVRQPSSSQSKAASLKRAVLLWLTFQNSVHTLLIRYVRARDVPHMFHSSVAVFFTETIKLAICVVAVLVEVGDVRTGLACIKINVVHNFVETAKVGVLSLIYTIQNNLFYLAASNLDAATFMVMSQLKILTTAVFAGVILRAKVRPLQWVALCILFTGVSIVLTESSNDAKSSKAKHDESPFVGFMAVLAGCCLSGFAGVYFEKILKTPVASTADASKTAAPSAPLTPVEAAAAEAASSVWMRNVQLAVCAIPAAFITAWSKDGGKFTEPGNGFMYGFDWVVWSCVVWYGVGGLSVAMCIKYADNILKNFSTSVAIVIATVASMYIWDFHPTLLYLFGAGLVIASIFMYSMPTK